MLKMGIKKNLSEFRQCSGSYDHSSILIHRGVLKN
jgi:hypothetical protein